MVAEIPVLRPKLIAHSRFAHRLEQIDSERIYSNGGAQNQELVEIISSYFGVDKDQVVVGSSATLMLTGAAVVMGQDRWFLPSWTFSASALALSNAGCHLCFIDIDPQSHVADVSKLRKRSNLLVVAPFGEQLTIDSEFNRCDFLLVDAAASVAHPVQYSPDFRGKERTVEIYSLHATKVLGVGEGGFAIVYDRSLAAKLRSWTNFGFDGSRSSSFAGTNAKMSEYSAAIGCETFLQANAEFEEWRASRARAETQEKRVGASGFFHSREHVAPYWIFTIPGVRVQSHVMSSNLLESGIASRQWWGSGCHTMPFFSSVEKLGPLDGTVQVARSTIGLPFSRDLSPRDFTRIGDELENILS